MGDETRYQQLPRTHAHRHAYVGQSAQPFLSYRLSGHFCTLHAARATRQADPPNEPNLVAVNFYRMGLSNSENRVKLGLIVTEI